MVSKARNSEPPNWKALFAAAAAASKIAERHDVVKLFIAEVDAALETHSAQPPRSGDLFAALGLAQLSSILSGVSPDNLATYRQLLAVNDVLTGSDPRLAIAFAEQQLVNPLVRLHDRIANAASKLSQVVVMVLCTITLMSSGRPSTLEDIASKPALLQLVISQLIFLATSPAVLLTPAGLGTAQRCVQVCWELTRTPAPHRTAFRDLLIQIDMAGRLLNLAATATSRGPHPSPEPGAVATKTAAADGATPALSDVEAALAGIAALDGKQTGGSAVECGSDGPSPVSATAAFVVVAGSGGDADMLEARLSLAAQATSMVANLAGLGNRGIELSASGLAPQRKWLLRQGTLAALRAPLEGLVDGIAALRRRIEERGHGAAGQLAQGPDTAALEAEDAELRPLPMPISRLLDQVEGAVRNALMLLGLPTIVMGTNEEDVVEACGFVIRHCFGLFTEGYVDTMKALRAAVADPPEPVVVGRAASSSPAAAPFTEPYQGDYGPFFRAYAGHIETIAPAIGVQLEDWGVRFTGEQAARDLPAMQVAEGVDARIAQSWLKAQIQDIINWGHTMMTLVRMADQAKMAAHQLALQKATAEQQQNQQGAQQGAQQEQGPQDAADPTSAAVVAMAPANAPCASCGAARQPAAPPLMMCGKCRGVRYCSRACQVSHWPAHKVACRPLQAAAAPLAAATPTAEARDMPPGTPAEEAEVPAPTQAMVAEGPAGAVESAGVAGTGNAASLGKVEAAEAADKGGAGSYGAGSGGCAVEGN